MGGEYRETITARLKLAVYHSGMKIGEIAQKAGMRMGTLPQRNASLLPWNIKTF